MKDAPPPVVVPETKRLVVDAVPVVVEFCAVTPPVEVMLVAFTVLAVMVPVAVKVPTVVDPRSALFAMKEVVAWSAPMVREPVLRAVPDGTPQPNVPAESVYWTKFAPAQSPNPF